MEKDLTKMIKEGCIENTKFQIELLNEQLESYMRDMEEMISGYKQYKNVYQLEHIAQSANRVAEYAAKIAVQQENLKKFEMLLKVAEQK